MQQQSTWERLAPLTGVVFVAIAVAVFAIGGSTPGNHDTAQKVQAFYGQHHDKHMALAFILALSIPFLLFFVSILRYELRRAGGTGQLANAAFAGGVLAAAGFGILAFVHLALADAADSANTIGTAQVLNVLDNNDYIPVAAGRWGAGARGRTVGSAPRRLAEVAGLGCRRDRRTDVHAGGFLRVSGLRHLDRDREHPVDAGAPVGAAPAPAT